MYNYLDHLGNVRMSYTLNELNVLTIIEENGYYPYGLKHENYNTVLNRYKAVLNETKVALKEQPGGGQVALNEGGNNYRFNGQEWQNELGLNITAMDYRQYDNALGRFNCVDPVTHFSQTPYQFGNGNPMYWADPSGLDGISPEPINTWHHAGGNQMNTGAGNLSNGDHMFGASGDAFWGGQAAFTGGDLAWKNYNAANGSQTFYGAEARAVFSHLGYKNGFRSFMYPDSESTVPGGMGVGFYKKKAPSYFTSKGSGEYGPAMSPWDKNNKFMNGLSNTFFGTVATIGAILAIPETAGASGIALTLTIGEIAIGVSQMADSFKTISHPNLHMANTILGQGAVVNKSPNAKFIDGLGGFIPGMFSGGNVVGFFGDLNSMIRAENTTQLLYGGSKVMDAGLDINGLYQD